MVVEALWFGGGVAVTLLTYIFAANGGGSYTVAWGAMAFGLFKLIKGAVVSGREELEDVGVNGLPAGSPEGVPVQRKLVLGLWFVIIGAVAVWAVMSR